MSATAPRADRSLRLKWHFAATLLAAGYPWFLARFYGEVHGHRIVGALLAIGLVFAVPAFAFLSLQGLAKCSEGDGRVAILRRLAHFAFVSPPLFVIVGVLLYLMKINGADGQVWLGLWAIVILGSVLTLVTKRSNTATELPDSNTAWVRKLHGVTSVVIIAVFLLPHLGNHTLGIFGNDAHKAVMSALRHVYRAGWLEPLLIGMFFFQIVSGLVLLSPKLLLKQDLLGSLQTASGAYLVVFIASHINSVFVLARYFGTETDYAWATGAPAGLMGDAWDVRLIPHYVLGVLLVLCHMACGLRTVMLSHRVDTPRANRITWLIIAICSIWTAVITAGLLGARV